jgi:WD40 repeat protein
MEKKIILITLIFFTLLIENSNGWCLKNIIDTNSSNVTNIDYSPDGTMIAIARMTSFTTNNVFIYDTNTYNIKLIIPTGSAINVTALKFSPNSSLLAIGYKNGTTSILNVNQGNTVSSFDTLLGGLNSLDISSDSNYIVLCGNSSASYKSILLIYNFDNWNIQLSVAGSSSVDYCLCCEFT